MIPISDNNPTHGRPVVTITLIVANVLIFLLGLSGGDGGQAFIWKYGYVPAALSHDRGEVRQALMQRERQVGQRLVIDRQGRPILIRPRSHADLAVQLPFWAKLLTCMFLHGGWMHLLGNMMYLWIFGNNIEDRLGAPLFIVFYLVTGVFGTLAHTWIEPRGLVPLVGASGAISGVLGAYILLFPHARVTALVPLGWYITTVDLPAYLFLGIYALLQILNGLPALSHMPEGGGVAYWAHIGGFAAGLGLIKLLPQKKYARPARLWRPFGDEDDDDDTPDRRWVRY